MIVPSSPISVADAAEHYDRLNALYCDVWGMHRHHGFWETGRESSSQAIELMAEKILAAAEIGPGKRLVGDYGLGGLCEPEALADKKVIRSYLPGRKTGGIEQS